MVTESMSGYTSPAGREFTLTAGRFAGIHPASRVLDMGCGFGEGVCNLVTEFRCRATAVDISEESLALCRDLAVERKVSHLVDLVCCDVLRADFSHDAFDLIMAEGGVLSFVGRREGLRTASSWLSSRGWFSFSDLIFLSNKIPPEIAEVFDNKAYHYESEGSYRALVEQAGFSIQFMCLAPPSGWDNYYAHMARRLEDTRGPFSSRGVKLAFHKEIDTFYRHEGYRHVAYLVCIARRND